MLDHLTEERTGWNGDRVLRNNHILSKITLTGFDKAVPDFSRFFVIAKVKRLLASGYNRTTAKLVNGGDIRHRRTVGVGCPSRKPTLRLLPDLRLSAACFSFCRNCLPPVTLFTIDAPSRIPGNNAPDNAKVNRPVHTPLNGTAPSPASNQRRKVSGDTTTTHRYCRYYPRRRKLNPATHW